MVFVSKVRASCRKLNHQLQKSLRLFRLWRLSARWDRARSTLKRSVPNQMERSSEEQIGIYVINLRQRGDRLREFSKSASSNGIPNWNRVEAVLGKDNHPGLDTVWANSIGCSLSHNGALQQFAESSHQVGLIFEDDTVLDVRWSEVTKLIQEFIDNPILDVLCLSYRARGGSLVISRNLRLVVGAVGRGAYVVKRHMVRPLQSANLAGVPKLERGNRRGKGDVMWGRLQRKKYFFAGPRWQAAHQHEGFSDIEQAVLGRR